jgi:signal transduction histidine kinase
VQEPRPESYQPRLTLWSHVWRILVCLLISTLAWGPNAMEQWRENLLFFWVDLTVGLAAYVLSFYRRRWPFPIAAVLTVATAFSASAAGPGLLVKVSLATRRVLWQLVSLGILGVVLSQVFYTPPEFWFSVGDDPPSPSDSSFWANLGFRVAFTVAAMAMGMYIGSRRELLWTLRQRAETAESEQALRVTQARTNERALIAREMHDVLAHRISLVSMHAGALAYRTDLTSEQVRESAEIIQAKAHEALTDLRQVLGVLRADGGAVADRPQPTYGDVPALVDEARAAGMVIDFNAVLLEGMPEQAGRAVYRIVQEGLTNARKHAPQAHARVTVTGTGDEGVTVTVWNPTTVGHRATAPGSGMGLVGLSERVQLFGGRLEHRSDSQGFTLTAWIPT